MNMTLALGDNFSVDVQYKTDKGLIATDYENIDILYIDIEKVTIDFECAGVIDITSLLSKQQIDIIENQIADWHYLK